MKKITMYVDDDLIALVEELRKKPLGLGCSESAMFKTAMQIGCVAMARSYHEPTPESVRSFSSLFPQKITQ